MLNKLLCVPEHQLLPSHRRASSSGSQQPTHTTWNRSQRHWDEGQDTLPAPHSQLGRLTLFHPGTASYPKDLARLASYSIFRSWHLHPAQGSGTPYSVHPCRTLLLHEMEESVPELFSRPGKGELCFSALSQQQQQLRGSPQGRRASVPAVSPRNAQFPAPAAKPKKPQGLWLCYYQQHRHLQYLTFPHQQLWHDTAHWY